MSRLLVILLLMAVAGLVAWQVIVDGEGAPERARVPPG